LTARQRFHGGVAQLGRFLQTDPQPGGSANAYAYTDDNPVNEADPSGEWTYNYENAETGEAAPGTPRSGNGPGAIAPPPADLQAEAEMAAHPPWEAALFAQVQQELEERGLYSASIASSCSFVCIVDGIAHKAKEAWDYVKAHAVGMPGYQIADRWKSIFWISWKISLSPASTALKRAQRTGTTSSLARHRPSMRRFIRQPSYSVAFKELSVVDRWSLRAPRCERAVR
jgi:hypothetical protein